MATMGQNWPKAWPTRYVDWDGAAVVLAQLRIDFGPSPAVAVVCAEWLCIASGSTTTMGERWPKKFPTRYIGRFGATWQMQNLWVDCVAGEVHESWLCVVGAPGGQGGGGGDGPEGNGEGGQVHDAPHAPTGPPPSGGGGEANVPHTPRGPPPSGGGGEARVHDARGFRKLKAMNFDECIPLSCERYPDNAPTIPGEPDPDDAETIESSDDAETIPGEPYPDDETIPDTPAAKRQKMANGIEDCRCKAITPGR